MFQNKDVICFFGDSITANGLWMAEVYQELRERIKVKCYNCGVSGANITSAMTYLHSECLRYNPTYVVLMFGINDIGRGYYGEDYRDHPDRERLMRECIERYARNYEAVLRQIYASGAEAIICIPVPYDEVSDVPEKNLHCQRGLDVIEGLLRGLAEQYNCPIVDFKATMQLMLGKKAIMEPDRVHPTSEGHHVMAQTFLRDVGVIEECNFETPFVFEEWNRVRYDAEQALHRTNFVEFCVLWQERAAGKSLEERKAIVRERYAQSENKNDFISQSYVEFLQTVDRRDLLLGEVVRLTVF